MNGLIMGIGGIGEKYKMVYVKITRTGDEAPLLESLVQSNGDMLQIPMYISGDSMLEDDPDYCGALNFGFVNYKILKGQKITMEITGVGK